MDKAIAFLRRDWQELASYRMALALQIAAVLLSAATFHFLSRLFEGAGGGAGLAAYGGAYFPFVLVGAAFFNFLVVVLHSFSASISGAKSAGTLEALLSTRTDIPGILLGSSLFPLLRGIVTVLLYLAAGAVFFNLRIVPRGVPAFAAAFALSVAGFAALGIISAAFVMVFQKGDPVTWAFSAVSSLLGGVMYPVGILPPWLRSCARFLPITPALEAVRKALLAGASVGEIGPELGALACFAAVLVPAAVVSFTAAVGRARRDGTLVRY